MYKTLDWDQGDEQLHFVEGGNGDMYLQIHFTEYDHLLKKVIHKVRSVRIGVGNSGGDILDYSVKNPLLEAAHNYIKLYKNTQFQENKIWQATEDNHKIW